jgi:hypothetical protein
MPGRQMLKSKGVVSHFVSNLSCKMCCTCSTDGQRIVCTCSPDGEQLAKGSKQPAGAVLCVCARSNKGRGRITGTGRPSALAGREGMQGHRNRPHMHGRFKNSSGKTLTEGKIVAQLDRTTHYGGASVCRPSDTLETVVPSCHLKWPHMPGPLPT